MLPEEVLRQAAAEMLDWHGSGHSVLEMSHRSQEFASIIASAERNLRDLLAIPDNYRVLFLQGGATLQFEMVPLNFLVGCGCADYVHTGIWSGKAIKAAQRLGKVNVVASAEDAKFTYVPPQNEWRLATDAAYVHYVANETIGGVEFHWTPDVELPLVCDMSSNLFSRPIDVSRYGLIYAGAQKNIGPAGLTIVIVREDLLGKAQPAPSLMMDYRTHTRAGSMHNTPPTYAIYVAGLVFDWLKGQGGLVAMAKNNYEKAQLLYDFIDASSFFANPVRKCDRSLMNVFFTLADPALDELFLTGAKERALLQLKGHQLIGGMRASIYNAMPLAGVQALVNYMQEFEAGH